MARPIPNLEYFVDIEFDEQGQVSKRLACRLHISNGVRTNICIGYQIRDPIDGRMKDIVRYDDFGGWGFHRHSAGFPPGTDHIIIKLPPGKDEFDYIEADILAHANLYESEAVKYGYEVPEDLE